MDEIVDTIIKKYKHLLGENPKVERIKIGFTNTIYVVDDSYIIKICTSSKNEENFKNEISFYEENAGIQFVPKLYAFSIDKNEIPYYYEILEKVDGISLYHVWHTLTEEEREEIIHQLCFIMKHIHSTKGNTYDWTKKIKEEFILFYDSCKNLFTLEEQKLLDYAYSKFEKYLESTDFVLIHNDLHFDNIFICNGKIKLIDFERSMYAPKDFELDIFYRMVKCPWLFASEEVEEYTNSSDYANIPSYMKKYYPDLVSIPYLSQRLAIYDMIYYLRQLKDYPNLQRLKEDILFAAKIVALKDEMTFQSLKSARDLMDFMDMNIEYGWIDKSLEKHFNTLKDFREKYRISSITEILESGVGTCIEQAKLIKFFFDKIGLENKLYCYRGFESEENFDKEVRMHCIVLFKYNESWYHFEHSNRMKRGIHKYESVSKAIEEITSGYKDDGDIRELTEIDSIPDHLTFKEFNQFVNEYDNQKNNGKEK